MKYLIIFKIIVLTSFPTYTKIMELTDETGNRIIIAIFDKEV